MQGAEPAVTDVDADGLDRSLNWRDLDDLSGRLAASLHHGGLTG